jgi:hypothetical protein
MRAEPELSAWQIAMSHGSRTSCIVAAVKRMTSLRQLYSPTMPPHAFAAPNAVDRLRPKDARRRTSGKHKLDARQGRKSACVS